VSNNLKLDLPQGRDNVRPIRNTRLFNAQRLSDPSLRTEVGYCVFLEHDVIIADAIEMSIARAIKLQKTIAAMGAGKIDGRSSRRDPDIATVGGRVQMLREARQWSQGTLAKSAGIAQATLANFERGRTRGGLALTLSKIARALGVDPEWLRTGKGGPTRHLDADSAEHEAVVIYRTLSDDAREGWMAAGRAMIATQIKKLTSDHK
jgi:transcriptional regulator with XRE-family HTH domain